MSVDFSKSHRAMDAQQHENSYSAFITIMIYGSVVAILTLIGMAVVLT